MFDDSTLVEDRIERLHERLGMELFRVLAPVQVTAWKAPGEPVDFATAAGGSYTPIASGDRWGPAWSTWWFKVSGTVPAEAKSERVQLRVDLGFEGDWAGNQSEGLAYTTAGTPLKGVNPMNRLIPLTGEGLPETIAKAGEQLLDDSGAVELLIEAGANPNMGDYMNNPTDLGDLSTRPDTPVWTFGGADLVVRNESVWHLWLDVEVLWGVLKEQPKDSTLRATLLRRLEEAADIVDAQGIQEGADAARAHLAPAIASGAGNSAQIMSAVGHAHIDSAWLWPLRETRRKVARTFSNVLALAEDYPEFTFACTSAQHYAWLKSGAPALFERVKDSIANGQWHPAGGMWVESDTNLPGGEALVRQFTVGLNWMERELGVAPTCTWLPDSFGYTGALPQIARLSGMTTFFTQKLNWSQTNTLPHHTFWWEGIDGTRIFTHFPPVDCYDSIVSAEEVYKAERNFKEKGRAKRSLLPYGYGDGGGGPVAEMVERARRFADMEGAPRVEFDSPDGFFDKAREEYPNAPVWSGEMYLEFHRGVYTSSAELKRGNREVEAKLAVLEWLGALATEHGIDYPLGEVEELWQRALLLQFHDILPGSSIHWVNREARAEYEALRTDIERLIDSLFASLAGGPRARVDSLRGERKEQTAALGGSEVTVLNPSPVVRREVWEHSDGCSLIEVAPFSAAPLSSVEVEPENPVTCEERGGDIVLANGLVEVVIDESGLVSSLRDLQAGGRELLAAGETANTLSIHPDFPSCFDAWELQHQYKRSETVLSEALEVKVVRDTPFTSCVEVRRAHGDSTFTQRITLEADSRAVDFEVHVDWREKHRVLRVGFPLALSARTDRSEIQFGHIDRAIAKNTSWQEAQFEVSGHRWALLEEPGYAVAFANSQTYGHDVRVLDAPGNERRGGVAFGYTLLRSATAPDPEVDLGEHTLRYSLVCDAGLEEAHAAGLRLTQPLREATPGFEVSPVASIDLHEGDTLAFIDAVKPADDGSGDLIVRLHEAEGRTGKAHVCFATAPREVHATNLRETDTPEAAPGLTACSEDSSLYEVSMHEFQIVTLRVAHA